MIDRGKRSKTLSEVKPVENRKWNLQGFLRIKKVLIRKKKKALIEAFVFSNFDYSPLALHFTSVRSTNKIDSIQKRALRLLYNDHTSTYDSLLAKASKPSMEPRMLESLAGCRTMFLLAAFCKISALERNTY